jgi:hypothetical protein
MQKKSKILGIAAFAVAFGAWGALFGAYKDSSQVIFPAGGFEIYTLTDAEAGGFSTSEMTATDTAVSARVNIRSGKAYPYAGIGFNLMSLNSRPVGYFDFSRYDSLAVMVETGRMRTVTLRLLTFDPTYSTQGQYLTYRPLEAEIAATGSGEVKVSLSDFKNKEWWLASQGLDKDDGLSYFFMTAMFEVFNGEGALRGIPDDIVLKGVRMWGEDRDFKKGMYAAIGVLLLFLGAFLFAAFKKPRDVSAFEKQMQETARLLTQTDKSVAEIAIAVGAKSASRLERDFCRLYGKKPLEYRKKNV